MKFKKIKEHIKSKLLSILLFVIVVSAVLIILATILEFTDASVSIALDIILTFALALITFEILIAHDQANKIQEQQAENLRLQNLTSHQQNRIQILRIKQLRLDQLYSKVFSEIPIGIPKFDVSTLTPEDMKILKKRGKDFDLYEKMNTEWTEEANGILEDMNDVGDKL
ncbi:MAG: hypothetical protein OXF85_01385 [Candidatus Saccharibacteria bacterium]|nr:hypothetical protein [Candidatus Saccharibacteria bacterium]